MWIIGVTGAIGAGKSTISNFFRNEGIPVHSADDYIHFLFEHDLEVQHKIRKLWPEVFVKDKIDRLLLGNTVLSSPHDLQRLETILYPKLVEDQRKFIDDNDKKGEPLVVMDVPLLFEVGLYSYCNFIILASASPSLRQVRVMKRQGMTKEKFNIFDSLQMKESEKRKKADLILYTRRPKANTLKIIQHLLFDLSQRPSPEWQGKWPKTLKRKSL